MKNIKVKRKSIINSYSFKRNIIGWAMMLPGIICFLVFIIQPLIESIMLSFFETRGFEALNFIGLQNYIDVVKDSLFITSLKNTAVYTIWSIVIGAFLPVIVAVMLNEVARAKGFYRFSVYFPAIIPGIATAIMWKVLF